MLKTKIIKRRKRVLTDIFLEGKPIIIEEGYEKDEVREDIKKEVDVKSMFYKNPMRGRRRATMRTVDGPVRTYTKKEVVMLDLSIKYRDKMTDTKRGFALRRPDLIALYQDIAKSYPESATVTRADIKDIIDKVYGRSLHSTNYVKHLQVMRNNGILTFNKKYVKFVPQVPEVEKPESKEPRKRTTEKSGFSEKRLNAETKFAISYGRNFLRVVNQYPSPVSMTIECERDVELHDLEQFVISVKDLIASIRNITMSKQTAADREMDLGEDRRPYATS